MLTWAVIPVLQGYALSGAFTVLGRLRSSLKRLWVFYLVIGALAGAGILGALAAGKLQLSTLPALVFTLSNTYGARAAVQGCRAAAMKGVCARWRACGGAAPAASRLALTQPHPPPPPLLTAQVWW